MIVGHVKLTITVSHQVTYSTSDNCWKYSGCAGYLTLNSPAACSAHLLLLLTLSLPHIQLQEPMSEGVVTTVEELCPRWWSHGCSDPLPQLPLGGRPETWVAYGSAPPGLCVFLLLWSHCGVSDGTLSEAGILLIKARCNLKHVLTVFFSKLSFYVCLCAHTEDIRQPQVSFLQPPALFLDIRPLMGLELTK